jgi:hypothetical protein
LSIANRLTGSREEKTDLEFDFAGLHNSAITKTIQQSQRQKTSPEQKNRNLKRKANPITNKSATARHTSLDRYVTIKTRNHTPRSKPSKPIN